MSGRLVILDRDGVINEDSDEFIKSPSEFVAIEGSIEAIALLSNAGFTVAVATNQSGVARGLLNDRTLDAIHDKLRLEVREAGGDIGRIVYCPHHPDDGCDCRKPAPGLLLRLAHQYGVPLDNVPMVGDSDRDIEAAKAAGCHPILVLTGNGRKTAEFFAKRGESIQTFANLNAAAKHIIGECGTRISE